MAVLGDLSPLPVISLTDTRSGFLTLGIEVTQVLQPESGSP